MQTLEEYLKDSKRGDKLKLAEKMGISKENLHHRVISGWRVGKLNGKKVVYNPKQFNQI